MEETVAPLTHKDFTSDQDVRWCPGCGDYAILSSMKKALPQLEHRKEDYVFVGGIGCAARFPYYMNTYGFHSIHGRAPAIASGAKLANPKLSVWIATGDGDAMSIGGNHLIHILRRNMDIKILMFNNRIYGLTKGQYSPTSELGKKTKSTPLGSLDHPFNPLSLALGSGATFAARTLDREIKHLGEIVKKCNEHKGTSFVDIYQNCNIYNDGAFSDLTEKETKAETQLKLEHGKPMIFGAKDDKGLILEGSSFKIVEIGKDYTKDDILIHDKEDKNLAMLLSEITYIPELPVPIGILYQKDKPTYEKMMMEQIQDAIQSKGKGDLKKILLGNNSWEVK